MSRLFWHNANNLIRYCLPRSDSGRKTQPPAFGPTRVTVGVIGAPCRPMVRFRGGLFRIKGGSDQPSHGRHSYVDRPRREAPLLQVKPIPQNHCFVEGQSRFRTVPRDELIDSMLVSAPRVGRTKAPEDCGFRVFQIRYAELCFGSVLLAFCLIRRRFPHDCRSPLRWIMRLMGYLSLLLRCA